MPGLKLSANRMSFLVAEEGISAFAREVITWQPLLS
jgi:hypothetical protein